MTVPNLITSIRLIMTPIFVIYLIDDELLSAMIVFVLSGVSDGIDGLVARLFNQKSKLGTYLDPLADKIILVTAYVALAVRHLLPSWLAVTVLARDVLILLGVLVMSLQRMDFNIKPSMLSKITTCLQFITVVAVLGRDYLKLPPELHIYLLYVTAVFTIASGLHYMHYWFKFMGEGINNNPKDTKMTHP